MIADWTVSTGGIRTEGAEPVLYVAVAPSVMKHLLLLPGDVSGGDAAHQPVQTQVLLGAEF